jgi:hypothetical protein
MTRRVFPAALVLAALLFIASPLLAGRRGPIAQILCAPSADMRHRLETQFRAHRAWSGLRGPEEVMELWEEPDGDWTLIITRASGMWCIVAMGEALMPFAERPHG